MNKKNTFGSCNCIFSDSITFIDEEKKNHGFYLVLLLKLHQKNYSNLLFNQFFLYQINFRANFWLCFKLKGLLLSCFWWKMQNRERKGDSLEKEKLVSRMCEISRDVKSSISCPLSILKQHEFFQH